MIPHKKMELVVNIAHSTAFYMAVGQNEIGHFQPLVRWRNMR
jgi:hypothetical protein